MIGTEARRRTSGRPSSGPQRALILASFVSRVGNGLFNAAAILYFTLVVHLPATQVGAGLTIAGLIGLAAGIPAGNLADRYGPRTVWLSGLVLQTVTMAAFVLIHGWLAFVLVATVDRLAATASGAAGGALIARVGGDHPAAFRARLRTFVNLGVVLGTLGAAFAVQSNTRPAYTALILANAASFACAALIALIGVPRQRPLPRPENHRQWSVLADRPYTSFVALHSAMACSTGRSRCSCRSGSPPTQMRRAGPWRRCTRSTAASACCCRAGSAPGWRPHGRAAAPSASPDSSFSSAVP